MKEPEEVDPIEFGRRVRELRTEYKWSQPKLGKASGQSQSNISWIEKGNAQDPKKQALALADALGSTPDWLLYGRGDRTTGIRPLTREQLNAIYDDLPYAVQMTILEAIKAGTALPTKKRTNR